MKKLLYIILLSISSNSIMAQNKKVIATSDDEKKVEQNTAKYSNVYFTDPKNSHVAIFFNVVNGVVTLDTAKVDVRKGKLPYSPPIGKDIKIEYFDKNGKLIGKYSIDDPLLVRTVEAENNEVKRISNGRFEVLLPDNKSITKLTIIEGNNIRKEFLLNPVLKKIR